MKDALINLEFPPISNKADLIGVDEALLKILDNPKVETPIPESFKAHLNTMASIFSLFHGEQPVLMEDIIAKLVACARTNGDSQVWAEKYLDTLNLMSPTSLKVSKDTTQSDRR